MQAQQDIFEIQSITIKDGLPNSNTYDILQDKNSFIWISTIGSLMRYDGYNFTNYDASFFNIDESAALNIALDKNNFIWFNERLAYKESPKSGVFDTEKEIIFDFEDFSDGLFKSEDVLTLNASRQDKDVIYITTKNGTVYKYEDNFKEIFKFSEPDARRVICDSDGLGNYWITYNDGDIIKVNSKAERIETFKIERPIFVIDKILQTKPYPIFEGHNKSLKKEYWQIKNNEVNTLKIGKSENFQLLHSTNSNWIYFKNDSIYKRNLRNASSKNADISVGAIPNLQYNAAFIDKQNILWISSANGLHKLVSKKNPFTIYQADNSIRGVFVENNNLWIGGYSRNVIHDISSKKERTIDFQNEAVTGFIKDHKNNLWLGSVVKDLYSYNLQSNNFKLYQNTDINALLLPFENPITRRIWVGRNNGLSYINTNDKLANYNSYNSLNGAQIRQFLYTKEGIWIVTNKGLFLMDAHKETIINHYSKSIGFPSDNINHIHKDNDGIFWIATKGNGLLKWTIETNDFKEFTRNQGLSNNTIYAVYEDDYKNLWLPSNYGLMRFEKTSNETQVFTVEDGIANNEFNTFSHFKNTDGTLYFGSIRGLISFHPKDFINKISVENPIYLSSLNILKKDSEEFETINSVPTWDRPILLNYDDQILKLEVSLLDYKYTGNHQYAYKIDNYHNQWIYTRDHKISIFNFPYGAHTISVRAKGDSDLWTAQTLVIPIDVNKPLYLKWQFLLLLALASVLSVYLLLKWRISKLNRDKIKLETEVKIRTQQIENDKNIIELQSEELKALDVAKGRFFANLTHEFRTPLTLIIGPLEQIIDNPPTGTLLKRRASGILNNAKHILGLINQLLDLTKLESKQMPVDFVHTDIIKHTTSLVDRFKLLAQQYQQNLNFYSTKTEWTVNFDSDKWDKIVSNLISNAIKFTPKHGTISVSLNSLNELDTEQIELIVRDTGIGIDENNRTAIFERFYQVDLSSKRANDGTGIGLALVKELVYLQDGSISIESKINEGSAFTVLLPIVSNVEIKPHIPNEQNSYLIPESINLKEPLITATNVTNKLDILVVDDNEDIRDYIVQCLGQKDYNISTAIDGDEGIKKALSIIPDLIVSDVMMPNKNGFELVEQLRNNISTSHIPIILLTAKANQDSKLQGLKRGADAYLTKPFNPKELDIRIKNLISIRQNLQNRYKQQTVFEIDENFEKEDAFIIALKTYILENINQPDLNGDVIGQHFGLSRIHLYRKLKALTDISISEFVKNIRLEKGLELVKANQLNVSEIAYEIGFTSPSHFSRSFKDKYGKSPSQM